MMKITAQSIRQGNGVGKATLTLHGSTLLPRAQKYQVYYNLLLEVLQETSSPKPQTVFTTAFYSSLTAGITMAIVLGFHIVKRIKKFDKA